MNTYDVYLVLHVVAVLVWVGAGFLMALLGARIGAAADASRRLSYSQDAEWLGLRLFLPASMLALGSGLLLVHRGHWSYQPLWIQLGIAALALSTVLGVAVFAPGWKRVGELAAERGVESSEVGRRIGILLLFEWVDLGVLLGAVWVMVMKPRAGDVAALVVAAAIPVALTVLGILLRLRARMPEAGAPAAMPAGAGVGDTTPA